MGFRDNATKMLMTKKVEIHDTNRNQCKYPFSKHFLKINYLMRQWNPQVTSTENMFLNKCLLLNSSFFSLIARRSPPLTGFDSTCVQRNGWAKRPDVESNRPPLVSGSLFPTFYIRNCHNKTICFLKKKTRTTCHKVIFI